MSGKEISKFIKLKISKKQTVRIISMRSGSAFPSSYSVTRNFETNIFRFGTASFILLHSLATWSVFIQIGNISLNVFIYVFNLDEWRIVLIVMKVWDAMFELAHVSFCFNFLCSENNILFSSQPLIVYDNTISGENWENIFTGILYTKLLLYRYSTTWNICQKWTFSIMK